MRGCVFGLNVDVVDLSSTPLDMLITLIVLAGIVALALLIFTYIGAPFVDKRWPADEPLNPVEMLWGESGGYIQRTFRGLDLGLSKDLASQFVEQKYDAGASIVEQGETGHALLCDQGRRGRGQPDASTAGRMVREDVINRMGAGQSFGETAILRRTARTATVRALTPVTVLELTAEDFVAGGCVQRRGGQRAAGPGRHLHAVRRRTGPVGARGAPGWAFSPAPMHPRPHRRRSPWPVPRQGLLRVWQADARRAGRWSLGLDRAEPGPTGRHAAAPAGSRWPCSKRVAVGRRALGGERLGGLGGRTGTRAPQRVTDEPDPPDLAALAGALAELTEVVRQQGELLGRIAIRLGVDDGEVDLHQEAARGATTCCGNGSGWSRASGATSRSSSRTSPGSRRSPSVSIPRSSNW